MIVPRAEHAEERVRLDEALRSVTQSLAGASGAQLFRAMAESLAHALGAMYGAVLELTPDGEELRVLGSVQPAMSGTGGAFAAAGTPAGLVARGDAVHIADSAREAFAADARLLRMGAAGYLGVPIADARGDVLGVIELAWAGAMREREPAETLVRTFAGRALAELERTQAEDALRDAEMRYRALIDDSFHLVAEVVDERLIYVSAGYTEALGHEPEALLGGSIFDIVHADDRGEVVAALHGMRMRQEAAHFTARMRTLDGRWRSMESTARSFRTTTGETRTSLFSRDITERLEAEAVLREREGRARALVQKLQSGVFLVDADLTVLVANEAALAILGMAEEELVGHSIAELAWQIPDGTAPPVAEAFRTGAPVTNPETPLQHVGTGERRWMHISAQPLPDAAGEVTQVVCSFTDVTERREAERALRTSEERFRSFAEHTSDLVLALGVGSVIEYASPNAQSLLGYAPATLTELRAVDLIHADDVEIAREAFRAGMQSRSTTELVLRVLHASAGTRWFHLTANFYESESGEPRAIVVGRDVTDRHEAEEALRESEQRLRGVVENAPLILAQMDLDGTVRYVAGAGLAALGIAPEVLLGRRVSEIFDDLPDTRLEIAAALAGKSFRTLLMINGRSLDAHIMPLAGEDGAPVSVIGVATDVTERLLAEQALRESEETSRALLNAPTDGAVLVDREGTILAHNATAAGRFDEYARKRGVEDPGSFIGTCVFDLFPPDLRAQRRARNDEIFVSGERRHFEDERDGVWTDLTIDPVRDASGKVVRLAIFSRDITDRKQDEAALRKRSRELEALNDYLEKTSTQLERSELELREASEQLAELLEAEQTRSKTDPLTGALNHGAITDVITEFIEAEVAFGLAMVDVDGMKAINDTFGHQAGDAVLMEVTSAITRGGAVAGRYGGDEFLVALLNADGQEAAVYQAAVEASLRDAHVTDPESGALVPVIASLGFATYPDEGRTLAELVERADERMYEEKRSRQGLSGLSSSRMVGGERAARMVGELVPLLTSAESLDDKLRLVSHRLSVGAGYAGVSFDVFSEEDADGSQGLGAANQNAFAKAPPELIKAWNEHQRSGSNTLGVGDLLRQTRRPLVIEDIETSGYITEDQRRLLGSIGIRSGIVVPLLTGDSMIATMSVGSKERAGFTLADEQFLTAVAGQVAAIIRMARLVEHLQQATDRLGESRDETVMLLAAAAEAHSPGGMAHFERVREAAELIAREMGFEGERLRELGLAAALHDIGKIRVPDALLSSAQQLGQVTAGGSLERELIRSHCEHGRAFLSGRRGFELASRVAYTHHERYDGQGYPEGLSGEAIPIESAIIAVADSLDAMVSERAYRMGSGLEDAVREVVSCRGTQFHPEVVDALARVHARGELAAWRGASAA